MDTDGEFAPPTPAAARERYAQFGPTAQVVVKQVAKAMELGPEEYDRRVTSAVVETAREAIFASLLEVHVGTRAEYDAWLDDHPDYEVREIGSEHVDNVVWHAAPATETVVAATFQNERRAAVGTLRRQAFGRVYRDLVTHDGADDAAAGDADEDDGAAAPDGPDPDDPTGD